MSVSDDFRAAVAQLRAWGFRVTEWSGCYGRSNGLGWSAGRPVGHVNHHYVCSLNPDQGYINGLVQGLADGTTVNWFADVNGVAYLIGTGPMNHAGTGNQSVLDRTRAGQPPPGPATSAGSITGNAHYSGTECQHPGDSTPWPRPMLETMVAINAAEFLVWGLKPDCAIDHYEWTSRKIDMSAGGGPSSGTWAGDQLRHYVGLQMAGTPTDWFDTVDEATLRQIIREEIANVPGDVWGFKQTSLVTGQEAPMAGIVLYTNQHTEPDAVGRAVWDHQLTSLVTQQPASAGSLLQYTNQHTEPE